MTYRFITCLTILVATLCASLSTAAQGRIDNVIARLEKDPKVSVTYNERRDSKTHKLIKQSTVLNGNSKTDVEALWRVFESERDQSVSVTKTRDQSFVIKFITNDILSTYILSVNGTSWSLVINKRPAEEDDYSWMEFNNLDALNGLAILNDLDSRISTGSNIRIYDSNGNLIFDNADGNSDTINIDKDKIKAQAKASAKTRKRPHSRSRSKSKSTSTTTVSNGLQTVTTVENSDGKTVATVYSI